MKLEPNFVADVFRIIFGRSSDPIESAIHARKIDSIEEFLAWIVLSGEIVNIETEIANSIRELALTRVGKAVTTRTVSGYDMETPKSLQDLRVAFESVIKADELTHPANINANSALARFVAAKDPGDDLLRFELDITI